MSKSSEALQRAFIADPGAIRSLMLNRAPCNAALVDHEFVPVERDMCMPGAHFTISAIGLVNAVLAANGLPLVAGMWEDGEKVGCDNFVGFCECTPTVEI